MIVKGLKKAIETDKSLSRGTIRNYDLINSFLGLIENTPEYEQMLASQGSQVHPAQSRLGGEGDMIESWKRDNGLEGTDPVFDFYDTMSFDRTPAFGLPTNTVYCRFYK